VTFDPFDTSDRGVQPQEEPFRIWADAESQNCQNSQNGGVTLAEGLSAVLTLLTFGFPRNPKVPPRIKSHLSKLSELPKPLSGYVATQAVNTLL
jgi:hypothetical protein